MKIRQFLYSSDNLGYLIYGSRSAIAIDGGAVEPIIDFVHKNNLRLTHVTHTHDHPDHTSGTRELLDKTGATFLDENYLLSNKKFDLDGEVISVYPTPGHTEDSVTFHFDNCLITGDTLFNGTVGNCFSGDLKSFYNSIKFITAFHENTAVYAGHDYLKYSMAFARIIEPENPYIDGYLKSYNPNHVCSFLKDELKVNPYLRFNDNCLTEILKQKGLPVSTEFERWNSIMNLG